MRHAYICGFNGFDQIRELGSFLQCVSNEGFPGCSERDKYEQSKDKFKTKSADCFSPKSNKTRNITHLEEFTLNRRQTETEQGDAGSSEVYPDQNSTSNAVCFRKMCSFPDTVQFVHVEMTWSRIGITMLTSKEVDFNQKQLEPDEQKLLTGQHQQNSNQQNDQNVCQTQSLKRDLQQDELQLCKQKHNLSQQRIHLSQPDSAEQAQHFTTFVCGFSGVESHIKESMYLLLDNCELKASNEAGMLLQQRDKMLLLGQGSRQAKMLSVVCGSHETKNISTIGSVSGMASKFVASYDVISVAELCVEQKEMGKNTGAESCGGYPRLLLSCLDSGLSVQHISCGLEHSVLLTSHGTVLTYGSSSRGQLGHGHLEEEESPRAVSVLEGVRCVCVAAGGWHSAAVTDCGDLYMWGWNECGQLGLPCPSLQSTRICSKYHPGKEKDISCQQQQQQVQSVEAEEPAAASLHLWPLCVDVVEATSDQSEKAVVVTDVACGTRHTAVLTAQGQAFTTGWNKYKQLGLSHTQSIDQFTRVPFPDNIKSIVTQLWCGAWNSMFVVQDPIPISSHMSSSPLSMNISS